MKNHIILFLFIFSVSAFLVACDAAETTDTKNEKDLKTEATSEKNESKNDKSSSTKEKETPNETVATESKTEQTAEAKSNETPSETIAIEKDTTPTARPAIMFTNGSVVNEISPGGVYYHQSAVHPPDILLSFYNANGTFAGDITPPQEGTIVDSTVESFDTPIYVKVGERLHIESSEELKNNYFYTFTPVDPNRNINEFIDQLQVVVGKGKFWGVIEGNHNTNGEVLYVLFEGI